MSDPTDERAAMIEAYEAQYGPCDRVEETALFFAWAARGEYERARAERLRADLVALQELIHGSYSHEADNDGCFEDCFVCEADLIVNHALAEPAPDEETRS